MKSHNLTIRMMLLIFILLIPVSGIVSCQLENLTGPAQPGLGREMDFADFYLAQNSFQYHRCVETEAELDELVPAGTAVSKSFLEPRNLQVQSGRQSISFTVTGDDLKRRMLLNLRHGSTQVEHVKAWLNGRPLAGFLPDRDLLNAETPDMVYNLCRWVEDGKNTLEIEVQGAQDAQVELFLVGFMELDWIPGQDGSTGEHYFDDSVEQDVIAIRFFKEIEVIYSNEQGIDSLRASDGLSLYPLKRYVQEFNIKSMYQVPPLPQWFYLVFEQGVDMQEMLDVLFGVPFLNVVSFRLEPVSLGED